MTVNDHKSQAQNHVACAVITVSDTRDFDSDKSGHYIKQSLESNGHVVKSHQIVKDVEIDIQVAIKNHIDDQAIEAILLNGGTGIAKRDVTYEVVEQIIQKEIPGFGELFRMLSYTEDIGSAAMLSRAIAGVASGTVIFSMPGSTGAVRLAMSKLIVPELTHLTYELKK